MEINLKLKNVKRISYELYDGSKIELDDGSFVKDDSYNKKSVPKIKECEVSRNALEAYKDSVYKDLTNRIKDKFNTIMDKADEWEIKNHYMNKDKDTETKNYYKTIV